MGLGSLSNLHLYRLPRTVPPPPEPHHFLLSSVVPSSSLHLRAPPLTLPLLRSLVSHHSLLLLLLHQAFHPSSPQVLLSNIHSSLQSFLLHLSFHPCLTSHSPLHPSFHFFSLLFLLLPPFLSFYTYYLCDCSLSLHQHTTATASTSPGATGNATNRNKSYKLRRQSAGKKKGGVCEGVGELTNQLRANLPLTRS